MNIERDFPVCLTSLTNAGIGKRKAKRMIRRAVHDMHKVGDKDFIADCRSITFCYHARQGDYYGDWQRALCY